MTRLLPVLLALLVVAPAIAQPKKSKGGLSGGPSVSPYAEGVGNTKVRKTSTAPHPEAAFQARLKAEALRLKADGTPGVELWTQVMRMATDHYADREDMTVARRFDAILRDTGAVLVGEHTMRKRIGQLRAADKSRFLDLPAARDPLLDWLLSEYDQMDFVYAGDNMDSTRGSDFRPEFRDGTYNQVFHSYFYVLLAYHTGNHHTVTLGNLAHELFDDGGSKQDYDVGNWAAILGVNLRMLRDAGKGNALQAIPTLFGATFGDDGSSYGHPDDNSGRDFREVARVVDDRVTKTVYNPSGGFLSGLTHATRRGAIAAFKWFR